MTPDEIKACLVKAGWVRNQRSGHYHKDMTMGGGKLVQTQMRPCRVRFNKASITLELHASTNAFWLRIAGASFDTCRLTDDGRLQALSFIFPAS